MYRNSVFLYMFFILLIPIMPTLNSLSSLDATRFETAEILKKLNKVSRKLAELKGLAASIPNQGILINTLGLQEAKDSSEIENIITTHDELYKNYILPNTLQNPAAKEVQYYREALLLAYKLLSENNLITTNNLIKIQACLERNNAGLRTQSGTKLINQTSGDIIHIPPQNPDEIVHLMSDLEKFINEPELFDADPVIKMALIHHQFESIHPFLDGNGRTGRILNILYLVKEGLLVVPVLYLSRYIVRNKSDYYRLLQAVRDADAWEDWVLYILDAVEETSIQTIGTINAIKELLADYKIRIRGQFKFYSQDLLNDLFRHPYTKVAILQNSLKISRQTATKYLDDLTTAGFLEKRKIGRSNYYINKALFDILRLD